MSHKADESFFESKRGWSRRKDFILGYYLAPYLAKVPKLRRPIVIVDGFAGPGKFGDGEDGSPLIICHAAETAISKGARVSVRCIEPDDHLFANLTQNLGLYPFATPHHSTFVAQVPELRNLAITHTLFLYLDPWTVAGLDWPELDQVFRTVEGNRASVELLLNFNSPIFVRCALAALRTYVPLIDAQTEDTEQIDRVPETPPSVEHLNRIVGGDWWQEVVLSADFKTAVANMTNGLCERLRARFREVGYISIKAKPEHQIPKYSLIFASRHADGLLLMNDAMAKSRSQSVFHYDLFSSQTLEELILKHTGGRIARGELIARVVRNAFCTFSTAEIRQFVGKLLKSGQLLSSTGRTRINDAIQISRH